jgi:hypothetical protein
LLKIGDFLIDDAYPPLQRHDGGLSSGEGIGSAIRDLVKNDDGTTNGGTDDKRFYITEAEFAGAMAAASREKSILSATIRNCFDGRDLGPLISTGKWKASNPHIVISGHITGSELLSKMTEVDAFSGFLNRFLILHVVRSKKVALPQRTKDSDISNIAERVAEIVRFCFDGDATHNNTTPVKMSKAAETFWIAEYDELTEEVEGVTGALLVKSEFYTRMLAMIFARLDRTIVIEIVHLKAALAWVHYWSESVNYIAGTLKEQEEARLLKEKAVLVLEYVKNNPGYSRTMLTTAFKHKLSSNEITEALNLLMNAAPPKVAY